MKNNKLVHGVGINDADHPVVVDGKHIKSYTKWKHMIGRCYCPKYQASKPTYIGVTVCSEWLYYTNFKNWFDLNYVEGYELDKDLLDPTNREYGPDKCIFVPQRINSLVIDCGGSRGGYPIGVTYNKRAKKFKAQICDGSGKQRYLGYFSTPEAAHRAYIIAKRQIIEDLKHELDAIDLRLYQSIMSRYPLPEAVNDPLYFLQEAA